MKHGTQYAYKIGKCHCTECKRWNAESMKKYRQNRLKRGDKLKEGRWVTAQSSLSQ